MAPKRSANNRDTKTMKNRKKERKKRDTGEIEGFFRDFEVEVDLVGNHDARDALLPRCVTRARFRLDWIRLD